ncbi:MAG: uridine kinase [Bradymonadales bacterium]|nr:uridine kinase [Bradymonadales bacterium]
MMDALAREGAVLSPVIIGIAGGTGSGKTTVANKIVNKLPASQAVVVQHDWYYRDMCQLKLEDRIKINYDEPKALENELLISHLLELKAGQSVECPQYDFSNHCRLTKTRHLDPRPIIVVEGILIFAVPALRDLMDLRLFVDTDDDIRLMRRIKRDILQRGRDIESIQKQYYDTVRPMHQLHVAPTKRFAHLVIPEGGENVQAVDVIVGRLLLTLWRMNKLIPGPPHP